MGKLLAVSPAKLRAFRRSRGISQTLLARRTGLHGYALAAGEDRREKKILMHTGWITLLAAGLGVTSKTLLKEIKA